MKISQIFIVGWLIIITGCDEIPLPETEQCTLLSTGSICTDSRLPDEDREYLREFSDMRGYQCTNVDDYQALLDDIEDKRKELAKLRRNCQN